MSQTLLCEKSEKVHFRDVVMGGGEALPIVFPYRIGIETRCRADYGQRGATRTLDDPCCIFQLTLEGEGLFEDERGQHALPPGTGFLCESHDPRIAYRYPRNAKEPWRFLYISFGGAGVTRMVRDFGEQGTRVLQVDPGQPAVTSLMTLASGEGSTLFLERAQAMRLVLDLLATIVPSQAEEPAGRSEQKIQRIQVLIEELLEQGRMDIGRLAERVGMSAAALCRFYREHTGESPYQYIRKKQMTVACQWLLEGKWTVNEIAVRLGFSSASNFIRSFKQIIGLTPTELISQGVIPRM